MKLEIHPPLVVAATSLPENATDLRCLVHARLWMRIDLTAWQVVRQGHLQLVRPPSGAGKWRTVDLSGHPMRLWRGHCPRVSLDGVETELTSWLSRTAQPFYRIPELAAVSEFGEGIDQFRRRVLGGVGEEVRRRIEEIEDAAHSRLPWRQRSEDSDRTRRRNRLASGVAGLAAGIEQLTVEDPAATVVRAEAGLMLVGPGIQLPPPAPRDLMLG